MDDAEIRLFPCRLGARAYLTDLGCKQNRERLRKFDRQKRSGRRLGDKLIGLVEDAELLEPCRTCPGAVELGRQSPEKVRVMLRTRNDRPIPRCKNGHAMVAENVSLDRGTRRCRACRRGQRRDGARGQDGGSVQVVDRSEGSGA